MRYIGRRRGGFPLAVVTKGGEEIVRHCSPKPAKGGKKKVERRATEATLIKTREETTLFTRGKEKRGAGSAIAFQGKVPGEEEMFTFRCLGQGDS